MNNGSACDESRFPAELFFGYACPWGAPFGLYFFALSRLSLTMAITIKCCSAYWPKRPIAMQKRAYFAKKPAKP